MLPSLIEDYGLHLAVTADSARDNHEAEPWFYP